MDHRIKAGTMIRWLWESGCLWDRNEVYEVLAVHPNSITVSSKMGPQSNISGGPSCWEFVSQPAPEAPYFIVWCPTGRTPPRYRHTTEDAAVKESMRLAKANPGLDFIVMAPRSSARASVTVESVAI